MKENTAAIHAQVPVDVATFLLNEKRADIHAVEARLKMDVVMIPNIHLETPHYTINRYRHDEMNQSEPLPPSYQLAERPAEEETAQGLPEARPERPEAAVKGITPAQPAPVVEPRPEPVAAPAPTAAVAPQPASRPSLWKRFLGFLSGGEPQQPAVPAVQPAPAPQERKERHPRDGRRERREGRDQRGQRGRPEDRREQREGREQRGQRSRPEERREPREAREPREPRAPREQRDPREAREPRPPREQQQRPPAEPRPAVMAPAPSEQPVEAHEGRGRRRRRSRGRGEGRGESGVVPAAGVVTEASAETTGATGAPEAHAPMSEAPQPVEAVFETLQEPEAPVRHVETPRAEEQTAPAPHMEERIVPEPEAPAPRSEEAQSLEPEAPRHSESVPAAKRDEPVVEAAKPERSKQAEMFGTLDLSASGLVMIETVRAKTQEIPPVPVEEIQPSRPRRPRAVKQTPVQEEPLVQIETARKEGTGTD